MGMNSIFRILKSGRELWRSYVLISVLVSVMSLAGLLMPLFSGWAIDEIRKGTDADVQRAAILAFCIFGLDVMQTITSNINGYYGDQVAVKLNKILSQRYFEHLLSLPQSYFDTELSGKIIGRLNRSISQITGFIQVMSNNFLYFILNTFFILIIVAFYSWEVSLMLFALYPIFTWMTIKSSSTWQNYQKEKNEHMDIASGRFAESIGQVKVVKSFIQERREINFFSTHMNKVVSINQPQSRFWHIQDVHRRMILNVIFLAVYLFIFVRGAQGVFTPGQAVALILYAMAIRMPIFTISYLVENTQKAVSDSKDYFEVMAVSPAIDDAKTAKPLAITEGRIEFKDVVFGYDKGIDVLKDISFVIEPNTKVALVGESGEGKTTLTNLLMRLYEPRSGTISVDDQDITSVTQLTLRQSIGVVFQDPSLFSGSIKENISYGMPKATSAQIRAAARAANAHEFIEKLPKGYDTEIGERGLRLSGGQKQRIAIARALLKDAPILILDEATSSLDSRSEAMVQEALTTLMKNRTTIIIAHRLSTIQHVDTIITLKNGKLHEIGTPKDLAHTGGIYAQLLDLQQTKSEKDKKKLQKFDIAG